MASSTYADQDPWATLLLFMSQGGDDAALIIADVNNQYDTALLAFQQFARRDVHGIARGNVAAVAPPALIALPQQPAPVLAVVAKDFYQEGIRPRPPTPPVYLSSFKL